MVTFSNEALRGDRELAAGIQEKKERGLDRESDHNWIPGRIISDSKKLSPGSIFLPGGANRPVMSITKPEG